MRCLKTKRVCTAPVECTNQGCVVVRNATAPADGPGMLSITTDEFAAIARDAERWRWLLAQFGTVKTEHFIVSGTFDSELARLVDKYAMAERNK